MFESYTALLWSKARPELKSEPALGNYNLVVAFSAVSFRFLKQRWPALVPFLDLFGLDQSMDPNSIKILINFFLLSFFDYAQSE